MAAAFHASRRAIAATAVLSVLVAVGASGAGAATGDPAALKRATPVGAEKAPPPTGPAGPRPLASAAAADRALDAAEAALAGAGAKEVTSALDQLAQLLPALHGADRRRGEGLLARPTDGSADPYDDGYTAPIQAAASTNFCYFWVESGADAIPLADSDGNGFPDYIEAVAAIAEEVYAVEHGTLGWEGPPDDGTLGCDAGDGRPRTDIYTKDLRGFYGYAAIDPGQSGARRYTFVVVDDDQAEFLGQYGSIVPPLQVTLAHEYNHVIQNGYDVFQDVWMKESVAVWMEEQVYPGVNDYLQYLDDFARQVGRPLTQFDPGSFYGSAVWNHYLSHRFRPVLIRDGWASSLLTAPRDLAVAAYDRAIRLASSGRSSFAQQFVRFAAATAEWRSTDVFPDGELYPEVQRLGTLRPSDRFFRRDFLDHTTFRLLRVPRLPVRAVKLVLQSPRGVSSGLALVGRIGSGAGASVVTVRRTFPNGGTGAIRLSRPGRFARLTAVLANGDIEVGGFSGAFQDWVYSGDRARFDAGVFAIR